MIFRHLKFKKCAKTQVFCTFSLANVLRAEAACHFFDIVTSKSASNMRCFVHFHFEMCFSPQWRAIFRHRNFKKCSENEVVCTFSLGNELRATAACNFRHLNFKKCSRALSFFNMFTCKCASRYSGLQFFDN